MREPKAFRRVELEPGQRQTVTVALTRRDLSYWDILPHPLRSYAVGSI